MRFKLDKWDQISRVLLSVSLGLPLLLIAHAVFASRELDEMRSVFLRERAATVAARLELLPPEQVQRNDFQELLKADSALFQIAVFGPSHPKSDNPRLEAVRSGNSLYGTEEVRIAGETVFRAYVPFHSAGAVQVAQIDLAANAADYILVHAQRNLLTAVAGGLVLLLVSLYGLWSLRRVAGLEIGRRETEHLAQLGRLSAVLAHEIRNPLGTIKGFAQLACEQAGPENHRPLEAILREITRLENLVTSLLLYGRPLHPVFRSVAWEALAADLATNAHDVIGSRPIEFVVESEVSNLWTDPDLLKQALVNLIRNSAEAFPERQEGKVSLRAGMGRDRSLLISLEDDGIGVPASVREKLFSPFFTTKASGTGLGLAISKKLVESLGGTLRLLPLEPHGTRAELAFYGTNSHHR